ncbi:MAG: cyanophycinase, partial [bacterium]
MKNFILLAFALIFTFSCSTEPELSNEETPAPRGSLFIIGGGGRPPGMVKDMIRLSGVDTAGYIAILPMASSEPDTSFYYAAKQFREQGIQNIYELRS